MTRYESGLPPGPPLPPTGAAHRLAHIETLVSRRGCCSDSRAAAITEVLDVTTDQPAGGVGVLGLSEARAILRAQPCSVLVGADITRFEDGHATITVPLRDDLRQQNGFAHGGVLSYAADTPSPSPLAVLSANPYSPQPSRSATCPAPPATSWRPARVLGTLAAAE